MPSLVGRKVTFTPTGAGTPVIGARTKSITMQNDAIDITSDDDDGFQTFLASDPAQRGISMSIEGVLKNDDLILLASESGSNLISEYILAIQGIGRFTGDFHIGTLSLEAPYKDAVTFTADVKSSGPFTYAPET